MLVWRLVSAGKLIHKYLITAQVSFYPLKTVALDSNLFCKNFCNAIVNCLGRILHRLILVCLSSTLLIFYAKLGYFMKIFSFVGFEFRERKIIQNLKMIFNLDLLFLHFFYEVKVNCYNFSLWLFFFWKICFFIIFIFFFHWSLINAWPVTYFFNTFYWIFPL